MVVDGVYVTIQHQRRCYSDYFDIINNNVIGNSTSLYLPSHSIMTVDLSAFVLFFKCKALRMAFLVFPILKLVG